MAARYDGHPGPPVLFARRHFPELLELRGAGEVSQLQQWFERYWQDGEDVRDEVLQVIERLGVPSIMMTDGLVSM